MSESKTMKQLHSRREKNYERMKHLPVQEQIKIIQTEAEAIKKRILDKVKKKQIEIVELFGKINFYNNYDYKKTRTSGSLC